MKKHITAEQIKEVDINKIFKYFDKKTIEAFNKMEEEFDKEFALKVLSIDMNIGKLMEILDAEWTKDEIFISRLDDMSWHVAFDLEIDYGYNVEIVQLEQCDALWEAVKEVL